MQSGDTVPSPKIDFASAEGRLQRAGGGCWAAGRWLMWHNKKPGAGLGTERKWETANFRDILMTMSGAERWVRCLGGDWGLRGGHYDDTEDILTRGGSCHCVSSNIRKNEQSLFSRFPITNCQELSQLCVMNFVVIQTNWNNGSAGTNLTMQIGKGRVTEYFEMFN